MKKKITALLAAALIAASGMIPVSAAETEKNLEERVKVDCGEMFGDHVDLYINAERPGDGAIWLENKNGIMTQKSMRFAGSPTDYDFLLSSKDKESLKSSLEEYAEKNLPGYEVTVTKQFEGLDVVSVKPANEIDVYTFEEGGFPEWMLSAEKYAERVGIAVQIYNALGLTPSVVFAGEKTSIIMLGDMDEDKEITMKDAMAALRLSDNANLFDDTLETYNAAADIDDDGKVTMKDAMYILRYADELNLGYEPTWDELLGK